MSTETKCADEDTEELKLDTQIAKSLFTEVKKCNFNNISSEIEKLGGKSIINKLRSPYGSSKQRLWMTVTWNNNEISSTKKLQFFKELESKYNPNFNLPNTYKCSIIHDLCMPDNNIDAETSKVILKYLMNESKCISKQAFIALDNSKRTPLHRAVSNRKIECIKLLLPFYSRNDLNILKDNNNKSIMDYANSYIYQLLLTGDDRKMFIDDTDDEKTISIIKETEKKIVSSSLKEVEAIKSKYDETKFKDSIKTDPKKAHLKDLDLDKKQLKTTYCLENQLLDFIFHFYDKSNNNKESKWSQAIAFWVTYEMMEDMIKSNENFKNLIKATDIIKYQIGALDIDKYNDEPLFIKGVMNAIRQSDALEQPFHITINIESCTTSTSSTSKPTKSSSTLNEFASGLSLPVKAIIPSYKTLYPLQIYEKKTNDDEEKYELIRDIAANAFKKESNREINDRLSIFIPSEESQCSFKIKLYRMSNNCINDIRFEILFDEKYISKKENKKPLVIKWKLDKNYNYNKNEHNKDQKLFKMYFYLGNLLNVWCTGNKKQINVLNAGHPRYDKNDSYYYIEAEIYGAYDIHIREQINFYDQYVDKFCFNSIYDKDYSNLCGDELKEFSCGGRPYYKPKGWKVYAINIERNNSKNLIKRGCVAFHATKLELLSSILRDGLVVPGTTLSMTGYRLPIPAGHITVSKVSGIDDDDFTNNVFASPSINYCSYGAYCHSFELSKGNKYKCKYAHLALKIFVEPKAIRVNRETIGWSSSSTKIDPNYNNNELEWRIRNAKDVIITALCIHESNITNNNVWSIKNKMRYNHNKLHQVRDVFELKDAFYLNFIDISNYSNVQTIELKKYLLSSTPIALVKKLYLAKLQSDINEKIVIDDIKLFVDKKNTYSVMNDNKVLGDYNINIENPNIYVIIINKGKIKIFIKTLYGARMSVHVTANDLIQTVKIKIESKLNVEWKQQNLISLYPSQLLENDRTLADYNIHKGSSLQRRSFHLIQSKHILSW